MCSDSELVAKARQGDMEAFDALVVRHHEMARRIARRFAAMDEDADDLVQEAFVSVYGRLHQIEDLEKFGAWLAAIIRNHGLMWRRRALTQPALLIFDEDITAPDIATSSAIASRHKEHTQAAREAVRHAIGMLCAGQRDVVRLHYIEGYDYSETATLLDIPVGAVRGRLGRARTALRKELSRMGISSTSGWELRSSDLEAIRASAICAYKKDDRPQLSTLLFTGKSQIISTDTHRMFCCSSVSLKGIPEVLVHVELARALRDQYPDARRGRLVLEDNQVVLRLEKGAEVVVPDIKEPVYSWQTAANIALQEHWTSRVMAPAQECLSALQALASMRKSVMSQGADDAMETRRTVVVVSPDDGLITLRAGEEPHSDCGLPWNASVSIRAKFGEGCAAVTFAADSQYVEDAIRACQLSSQQLVELSIDGPKDPFLIRSAEHHDTWVLTMPMLLPGQS